MLSKNNANGFFRVALYDFVQSYFTSYECGFNNLNGTLQIIFILTPFQRIFKDIYANTVQIIFISNYMFIIIALP